MIEFLSLSNDSFGLEITDVSARLAKLARRGGRICVAAVGYAAIPEGVVKDGDIRDEGILSAVIREMVARAAGDKIKTKRVIMSLPENKAFLQVIRMPLLNGNDLRDAVIFEAENYIPLPLEKVYLDFEKVAAGAPQDAGGSCEILIAALPRDAIDSRIRAAIGAGLLPVAMELESQAVLRSLSAGRILESPSIIIQIGDAKTNLIVYSGNSIRFTFSIPISNRYFLETISASAKVDMDVAAVLKTRYGIEEFSNFPQGGTVVDPSSEGGRRKIFEALVPGLVDFTQQVKKCIQYYQTHGNDPDARKKNGKIFICGSGSDLKGLDEFISLKLDYPVERIAPLVDISMVEKKFTSVAMRRDHCGFTIATGLAMRSLEQGAPEKKESRQNSRVPVPQKKAGRRMAVRIR